MKQVSITVLVENTAQGHGLLGEHGLSFWIEIGPRRILFDAGQTNVVSHNSGLLDIDLSSMDAMVLSHGHYDHTGGLAAIARSTTRREKGVAAYAHPRALEDKYARNADGTGRYIGMAADSRNALHTSFELRKTEAPIEVGEGLMVTGPIPRITDFEDTGGPFFKDPECRQPDDLIDDQAAFLETSAGTVVILGCAHAGIVNTVTYAQEISGVERVLAILGGFHLAPAKDDEIELTIDAIQRVAPELICPLHCSGFTARSRFAARMPEAYVQGLVGTKFLF